jgi:hypothetical protein
MNKILKSFLRIQRMYVKQLSVCSLLCLMLIGTAARAHAQGSAPSSNTVSGNNAKCPSDVVNVTLDTPIINSITLGTTDSPSTVVSGKMPRAKSGNVQVCIDGKALGTPVAVGADGTFKVTAQVKVTDTQSVVAQLETPASGGSPAYFGLPSDPLKAGSCSKAASPGGTAPTLSIGFDASNKAIFSGTVKGATSGEVRICVNDVQIDDQTAPITSDGKFNGGTKSFSVSSNDKIVAQTCTGSTCSAPYGPVSNIVPITSGPPMVGSGSPSKSNGPTAIVIGGVEYAGYSSQSQTVNGFLNIFYQGPVSNQGISGWARIRLTSAAQPATNGVVSVISNPTGLTTYNYANVGQVLDFVVGPSWRFTQHWALIGDFGAITPLSSQSVPVTFVAPAFGTQECSTLVNRFSPQNGYNPGLSLNTATNPATCLMGGYTDIAFSNQDRSNFLLKYGAGVRTWYPFGACKTGSSNSNCSAFAAVDATLGQDSSVTGGLLRSVVFKLDGILPIPTGGGTSWLYLFGSTYIRLQRNQNLPPLILQTPNPPVAVPSPTVVVLPLVQPNRDYYRLGVGLNINQLWCKAFSSTCPTSTPTTGNDNPVPTLTSLNPPNVKVGAAQFTLTVTGSNFVSASTIQWNGANLKTTYVSATLVSADIPASDVAKAGTATISVLNPSPGGGASTSTLKFTIQ